MRKGSLYASMFLFLVVASLAHADNLYWVSFSNVNFGPNYTNFSYVMQIDSMGNVTMAPKQINFINWIPGPEVTALARRDNNTLDCWISFAGGPVRHAFINTSTLTASGLQKLSIVNYSPNLQVPDSGAFLAMIRTSPANESGYAEGYGLLDTGFYDGSHWGLSPRTRVRNDYVTVSADGLVAIGTAFPANQGIQLYEQRLKPNGLPDGNPLVLTSTGHNIGPDISNPLPGNQRFLIYWSALNPGQATLTLQKVDATTGQKIGGPNGFYTLPAHLGSDQDLAMDPYGQFVLFGRDNGSCDDLYFQALDATGNASGSPRKIVPCTSQDGGVYGINILKN